MREVPRVVLAAAEAVPLAKAGGLGDVTSALASALTAAGCEVTLLLPAYGFIDRSQLRVRPLHGFRTFVRIAERDEPVQLLEGVLPGTAVRLLLIDHEGFFARGALGLPVPGRVGGASGAGLGAGRSASE
jgi:starch synthase